MASLEPVRAGFVVVPSRKRERSYLGYLRERGDGTVPLDGALFEQRAADDGQHVVLLPLRSYEAARRICQVFERAARTHERALRRRAGLSLAGDEE